MIIHHATLSESVQALRDFMFDRIEAAPAPIRDAIRVQTDDLVSFGELLRSIYDYPAGEGSAAAIGPELASIAAAGLGVIARYGYLDLGKPDDTGRVPAARMRATMLREAGVAAPEGMSWPDAEDDYPRRVDAAVAAPTPPTLPNAEPE